MTLFASLERVVHRTALSRSVSGIRLGISTPTHWGLLKQPDNQKALSSLILTASLVQSLAVWLASHFAEIVLALPRAIKAPSVADQREAS